MRSINPQQTNKETNTPSIRATYASETLFLTLYGPVIGDRWRANIFVELSCSGYTFLIFVRNSSEFIAFGHRTRKFVDSKNNKIFSIGFFHDTLISNEISSMPIVPDTLMELLLNLKPVLQLMAAQKGNYQHSSTLLSIYPSIVNFFVAYTVIAILI